MAPGTLAWSTYTDPDVLALERRGIFERAWHYVGHTGDVPEPSSYAAVAAGHVPVALVRGEDGELRAFLNVCRHRGHEVVSGSGARKTLQCPYHAWTYELDGTLRSAPRSEREEGFDAEGLSLVGMRLETWGPLVFVNADPEAQPLSEALEGVPAALAQGGIDLDELVHRRRLPYALDANWKVVMENYLECYHCPVAHPGFSKEVDVDPDSYVLEAGGRTSSQYARSRNGDGRGQFHFVWPNLRVNVFPGSPNLSLGSAWPVGPTRTAGFFDYFFPAETSDAEIEELLAFDGQVSGEDRALVESVQRGVGSGLLQEGRLMPESERLIAHFQRLVHESYE